MRFAVFTHVIHREKKGRYYAYSPYVREMNMWFKYAKEVEIVASNIRTHKEKSFVAESYKHSNLSFTEIPAFHLLNFQAALDSIIRIPVIFFRILAAMRRANHLHLRCPGNIGLLAAFAQVFFPKKPKSVKYAGNWDPNAKQPWTYKLQKCILSNRFLSRNIKVLVYGNWPNQSDNIVPFFTASFSKKQRESIVKNFKQPYKFIFTGNLVEGKGIFEAIDLIESLNSKGVISELRIYGDGILESSLRAYIQKKELQNCVKLKGRKSLEELKQAYKKAHFVVLLSKSEGWPKALTEGMWYGCVPVATRVSCVPWMLNGPSVPKGETNIVTLGKRGILIRDSVLGKFQKDRQFESPSTRRDVSRTGFSEKDLSEIVSLIESPEKLKQMSIAAQEWSQQYTLEKFEKAIQEILGKHPPHVTTQNGEPTTENLQLKTHNPQPPTDNPKQQTPNNKPYPQHPFARASASEYTTQNSQLRTDTSELAKDNNKQQTTNHKQFRVLQLIDTLNPGGAERMTVNLANSLVTEIETSYLCCTREEGLLKEELEEGVGYLFLNKRHSLDLRPFLKLRSFVKKEKIGLVHGHGTSWFWGVLLKFSGLKIKLVWHDHYGESEHLKQRNIRLLKPFSRYFDGIISVNNDLKAWALKRLKCRAVMQLNNFICTSNKGNSMETLKGSSTDFKIICVANLRPQKDHVNLLAAFEKLDIKEISLHLIGTDPETSYSKEVREKIAGSGKKIFYYGSLPEVAGLLSQADLGVLSSRSEGLPLALLEYALVGLPVVCTDVGQCKEVTGSSAMLVAAGNPVALAVAIEEYYWDRKGRERDAISLKKRIKEAYSKEEILPHFLEFYTNSKLR